MKCCMIYRYFLFAVCATAMSAVVADAPKVDARYLPERLDDFCWENPFCGMRAYGPKLAEPRPIGQGLVTSGIDVFNKGVTNVVMVEKILRSLKEDFSYHTPDGICFDSYTVGAGRGCGGIARRDPDGTWHYDGNWKEQRVLEKTDTKAVFELVYDTYILRGTVLSDTPFVKFEATPTVTLPKGSQWGPGLDISPERGHDGIRKIDPLAGYAALYEPKSANWTMSAIRLDFAHLPASVAFDDKGCVYLLTSADKKIVFYAGAAWGGAGVFTTAEKWFDFVKEAGKGKGIEDRGSYKVDVDRASGIYRCGEKATFTVRLNSTNGIVKTDNPIAKLDNFGSSVITNLPFDISVTGAVITLSGTLREPGFLRLTLPATANNRADPYVYSVGFEPEKIVKGSPSPADFDAFWAESRARLAREVPIDAQIIKVAEKSTDKFDFYRISFATFGRRVYGYMSIPADKSKAPYPVILGVNSAGFGGWTNDMEGDADVIRVQFSVYPFEPHWKWQEIGLREKYVAMDKEFKAKYAVERYCHAGISVSREDYFFFPVILGIDRAVDHIAARPDVDRTRFVYQGTSQGGGFGFYLCALNRTFTRAAFYVPAITDTMGYLSGRESGWPKIIENNSATPEKRAVAEKFAPYFDAANFAGRIKCPVRVAVGFSDIICPPSAVYAAYNEIKVKDRLIRDGIGMTHACFGEFYAEFDTWLRAK